MHTETQELPRFRLPMLAGGTYRAFEIAGDAMLPIASGTTIVGRYVEAWSTIKGGTPCIVVTQKGIEFRRLYPLTDGFCLLHDHPATSPKSERASTIRFDDILEIWEAKSYISAYPMPGSVTLETTAKLVQDLKQQVKNLR
jgi:hypothetical protein